MSTLPPFPTDDATLGLLLATANPWQYGNPDAEQSSVENFLDFLAAMGGSDLDAVAEVIDDGSDGGATIRVMRDPRYCVNNVLEALVLEIQRLRGTR